MEQVELDTALEELELRLERLRALYEQYFMGLEKIEPAIARKDVDRRIYVLRREKIRNTAKRFKLQTIIQRYNTYQQYWQRICREIENGTYKRHLIKAQKSGALLTIAARKRLGRQGRLSQPPEADKQSQPPSSEPSAPPSAPPAVAPVASAEPIAAAAGTPAASAVPAVAPRSLGSPPLPRRPAPPMRPGAPAPAAASSVAPAPPIAAAPAPPIAAARAAPAVPASAPLHAATRPAPQPKPAAKFESLDLDMDFMGDWDPGTQRASPKVSPAARAVPPAVAPAPKAAAPAPPAASARPASIPPAPVAAPPRPVSSRPPTAPPALARPAAPRIQPGMSPLGAAPPPKPVAARPASPVAVPAPAPPKVAAAPPAVGGHVDDSRLRDLHARLQQAKQQTKEANVSFEGLAKSIRAAEAKLREQHKDRKIDFDVVIKDGKAVVKPIVR